MGKVPILHSPPPKRKNQLESVLDEVESAVVGGVKDGCNPCNVNFVCGASQFPDEMPSKTREEGAEGSTFLTAMTSNFDESMFTEYTTATTASSIGLRERSEEFMTITYPESPSAVTKRDDDHEQSVLKISMPTNLETSKEEGKERFVSTLVNRRAPGDGKEAKSPLSLAGSQSATGMSLTESFSYDGMPPPLTIESSFTEKGDDELFLEERLAELNRQVDESPSKMMMPFTPRPGKPFFWRKVSMVVAARDDNELQRKVLNQVYGEVPECKTTALVGARGAGKTSLLNILSGRLKTGKRIYVKGETFYDNIPVDPYDSEYRKSVAFVPQNEYLQSNATTHEAIKFCAKLRLSRSTSDTEIDQLVASTVFELGLMSCAVNEISRVNSSEKKRISIGMEIISKPSCLFLDEPISGMDTLEAMQVCSLLKKLARTGTTVLFSIQKPESEIFRSGFDHMIHLHKGMVVFQGPASTAPDFFANRGFPCPLNFSFVDWMLQVSQTHPIGILSQRGFYASEGQLAVECENADLVKIEDDERTKSAMLTLALSERSSNPPGVTTQVQMLLQREFVSRSRTIWPTVTQLGLTLLFGLLIGTIFLKVGETSSADVFNLQSQFGCLIILLSFAMLRTALCTIDQFSNKRSLFIRECVASDYYSSSAFYIAQICIEAAETGLHTCILVLLIYFLVGFRGSFDMFLAITYALSMASGAMASFIGTLTWGNEKTALLVTAAVFLTQLLFTGFFVVTDLIPNFYSWVQWMCVLSPASKLLLVEEFYDCGNSSEESEQCLNLLERVEAYPEESAQDWSTIAAYYFIFRIAAIFLMK